MAENFILIIDNYISCNSELPEYSHQQHSIINPHIFDEIDTVEKAYWLGFLCADASLFVRPTNKYEISLEISSRDKAELYKLAKFIGIDEQHIKDRVRLVNLKEGKTSLSKMSKLRFLCFPMGEALIKNGKVDDGILNKVEMAFRAYDPCLACASHSLNAKVIFIKIYNKNGEVIKTF